MPFTKVTEFTFSFSPSPSLLLQLPLLPLLLRTWLKRMTDKKNLSTVSSDMNIRSLVCLCVTLRSFSMCDVIFTFFHCCSVFPLSRERGLA